MRDGASTLEFDEYHEYEEPIEKEGGQIIHTHYAYLCEEHAVHGSDTCLPDASLGQGDAPICCGALGCPEEAVYSYDFLPKE